MPVIENRQADYYFDAPVQKTDVTTIDLPTGFEVEALPANQNLKFTYGSYEVSYVYDASKNQIINKTTCNITDRMVPAAKYTEMQQYADAIIKTENKKLIIRKKA